MDRDFNINRIERYLAITNIANIDQIIILNKSDLITEEKEEELVSGIRSRISNVPIISISNKSGKGINIIKNYIERGKTYCLLGSSGVGKSSLLNTLLGIPLMKTGEISNSSNRGQHITSHRELQILDSGGIIIDNPGMREVGITDSEEGLQSTFYKIIEISKNCKFNDCTHTTEIACAVLESVESGIIDKESYENFLRMEREKEHYKANIIEKRRKDKAFGKMVKSVMKHKKRNKF